MTHQEIAKAYGITHWAVSKWSAEKRQQAIADLNAGVQPHIAELVGKLSIACYRASCHTGDQYVIEIYAKNKYFDVHLFDDVSCKALVQISDLNTVNLAGALAKVEELCK